MHLELNHSSAGAWSDLVDIGSREPEIKASFSAKNGGIPRPYTGGGKYYLMNGLDASQGNHALTAVSVLQGTDADLSSAIQAHLNGSRRVCREKRRCAATQYYPIIEGNPIGLIISGCS